MNDYKATLEVNGERLSGRGETLLEALQTIPKLGKVVTKGVISLEHKDTKMVRFLSALQIKRILNNPVYTTIWAKQFNTAL